MVIPVTVLGLFLPLSINGWKQMKKYIGSYSANECTRLNFLKLHITEIQMSCLPIERKLLTNLWIFRLIICQKLSKRDDRRKSWIRHRKEASKKSLLRNEQSAVWRLAIDAADETGIGREIHKSHAENQDFICNVSASQPLQSRGLLCSEYEIISVSSSIQLTAAAGRLGTRHRWRLTSPQFFNCNSPIKVAV